MPTDAFGIILELLIIASMLLICITDWRARRVPEACTLPMIGLCLYYALLHHRIDVQLAGGALIGGWLFAMRTIGFLVNKREVMGFGDVTMGVLLGVFCGPVGALGAIVVGSSLGLLIEIVRKALQPQRGVPLASYMAIGTLVLITAVPHIDVVRLGIYPLISLY